MGPSTVHSMPSDATSRSWTAWMWLGRRSLPALAVRLDKYAIGLAPDATAASIALGVTTQ